MTSTSPADPETFPSATTTTVEKTRLTSAVVAAAVLLLLVAWVTLAAVLYLKWRDAVEAEIRQNANLALALDEQTTRVLAAVDQATRRLSGDMAARPANKPEMARYASETGLVPNILVQLSLLDGQGRFVASNLDTDGSKTGPVDLSAREHVRVHLSPLSMAPQDRLSHPDNLFIGKPVLGRVSGKWTIQLSRRIALPDGQLQGVVVASLDPAYFENVYRRVQLGKQGGVTLLGADLMVRARVIGGTSSGLGSTLDSQGAFAQTMRKNEGNFQAASSVDGVVRITAFRRVADYPLYLLVSTAKDEALADWHALRNVTATLTLLLSLVVAAGATSFVLSVRKLELSNAALRASEAQAQAANLAKSDFLAAMSHELRTPLTSIRGFAELMEHRLEQPRYRETAGLIRKGAEHLNELLTQILDLAKVEAGAMPLTQEPIDLSSLVHGTIDFFRLSAEGKGLTLDCTVASDLPLTIRCDGLKLKQILNNLLSNAVKFTVVGGVNLRVSAHGQTLRFEVQDTGPGVAPNAQALIFEKFRQADARVSYEHGGTGLGLSLSRALTELMGGSLTLQSVPGQGATFTVTLPLTLP
jgi:signal transduction histidine kinase